MQEVRSGREDRECHLKETQGAGQLDMLITRPRDVMAPRLTTSKPILPAASCICILLRKCLSGDQGCSHNHLLFTALILYLMKTDNDL